MTSLEDLRVGSSVNVSIPHCLVAVVSIKWHGSDVPELTYKDSAGNLGNELVFRDRESKLEVITAGRPWGFDANGSLFRLVSEAHRIRLAHLFYPVLVLHTSLVDPLLHQSTGVYKAMLLRQPLRFLLANDPANSNTFLDESFIRR